LFEINAPITITIHSKAANAAWHELGQANGACIRAVLI
jgi:hypothetical protein